MYFLRKWPSGDVMFLNLGSQKYVILPLHSQIPREDQRKVFQPVPDGTRKVNSSLENNT